MRELLNWKVTVFRRRGLKVSLHLFFFLFAFYVIFVALAQGDNQDLLLSIGGLAILAASVLLFEFSRLMAARWLHGDSDELLLWPLGGLKVPKLSSEFKPDHLAAQESLLICGAGVFANVVVCLFVAPALILLEAKLWELLNPFHPPTHLEGPAFTIGLIFWVNYSLMLLNLLPALPLSGGYMLRALLWKSIDYTEANLWTVRATMVVAIALFLSGLLWFDAIFYAHIPRALLGVLLFFWARQEMRSMEDAHSSESDHFLGYDFSEGYTSLERTQEELERETAPPEKPAQQSLIQRWLTRRREAKQQREREIAEEEERISDELLARIHANGVDALSEEEMQLLKRVSQRIRSRRE